MRANGKQGSNTERQLSAVRSMAILAKVVMKSISLSTVAVLALSGVSRAKDLPNAPSAELTPVTPASFVVETTVPAPAQKRVLETNPVDAKFVSLALISTGSTFADSYTTLFARQNWLAGKKGVCNVEVQSAYLYGTHPTVGRTYAVASVKSVGSLAAAYYLRKHHNRFWSMPLFANSIISLQGVTQNMAACN
jgi:hypothetical protein